jgi:type II secretory pathway pseudopilin PulG
MRLQTNRFRTSGLTLMELVVVVAILAFLAGMVTFNLTPNQLTFAGAGGNKTAGRIATEATMARIKGSIFGSEAGPGYWQDMNRDMWYWPVFLEWLSRAPNEVGSAGNTAEELVYHTSMMGYSPTRRVGWRGPYLQFQGSDLVLDPSRGFTARLGAANPPTRRSPTDGWGRPIVMQLPSEYLGTLIGSTATIRDDVDLSLFVSSNSRLVSAGPDGILQTEININALQTYEDFQLNPSLVGDDVVVWIQH